MKLLSKYLRAKRKFALHPIIQEHDLPGELSVGICFDFYQLPEQLNRIRLKCAANFHEFNNIYPPLPAFVFLLRTIAARILGVGRMSFFLATSATRLMYELENDRETVRLGFKHHAKVQGFWFFTVVLAWALIAAAFYYRPDLKKQALRSSTRMFETIGDAIPSTWGDRIEIMLRQIGGCIWSQITAFIVALRVIFRAIAALRRRGRRFKGHRQVRTSRNETALTINSADIAEAIEMMNTRVVC